VRRSQPKNGRSRAFKKRRNRAFTKSDLIRLRRSHDFFKWQYYTNRQNECQPQTEYTEDGIPTPTTSLKNVGLNEPERSGAEDIPATRVILSPLCVSSSARLTAPCLNNMLCGGRCFMQPRFVSLDPVCRLQPMPFGWM
jgi:hypothetical protein